MCYFTSGRWIIKYFDDGGKNMSFIMDDEKIYEKYNKIWEVIRKLLKVNFVVSPVRDDKYLVAKLKNVCWNK